MGKRGSLRNEDCEPPDEGSDSEIANETPIQKETDKPNGSEPDATPPYEEYLSMIVDAVQTFMHLPDPAPFVITLGAVAANMVEGGLVWLMLVGSPSSGKTDILHVTSGVPGLHMASTMSEAALLSGVAKKDREKGATGGLLRQIGDWGIVVAKDFGTVLSMNRDQRAALLAALREIYDGSWTRHVGTGGGRQLAWSGRVGFLGGVTDAIDTHHSVIASLGHRFVYCRMAELDGLVVARKVLSRTDKDQQSRDDLKVHVSGFIDTLDFTLKPFEEEDKEWLAVLSKIAALTRSAVERDSYKRDITNVPTPEAPGRLANSLGQLFRGLRIIGCSQREARRLTRKVALDCIPKERSRVLEILAIRTAGLKTAQMKQGLNVDYPHTAVQRALEELECLRIVVRSGGGVNWMLKPSFKELWARLDV